MYGIGKSDRLIVAERRSKKEDGAPVYRYDAKRDWSGRRGGWTTQLW